METSAPFGDRILQQSPLCIDGRLLGDGGVGTGVSQYARTTVAALQGIGVKVGILSDGGGPARRSRIAKWLSATRPGMRATSVVEGGFFARDIFREAQVYFNLYGQPMALEFPGVPGVMHWSYPLPMRVNGWRNLYTVHDVLPLDPSIPSPVDGPRLRRMLNALREAGGEFVTVSDAARSQITMRLGWTDAEVRCCHQAADVTAYSDGPLPHGLRRGDYLLYVGAVETRKNLARLIEAYRISGIATPLVISGPDGMGVREIDAQIAETAGAIRLGLQPREVVLRLMAHARGLTFVSLGEGFGLPVVEAMALKTPVLASDVPAIAEVAGGAALLVNPMSVADLRHGLIALDSDASLRDRLIGAGETRSQQFSIDAYARRLQNLYWAA